MSESLVFSSGETVHVLVACRYALLYWQTRQSLYVVTRGLEMLLCNLIASVISILACCLRQIAADTPPDSPLAFEVPCLYMEVATVCMTILLFPSVIDRGVVLAVKFDPRLRARFGSYVTTRHRGRVLVVYAMCGSFLYLIPELLGTKCVVKGCDYPNCFMASSLLALFPVSFMQFVLVGILAYRLSLIDLEQENLGTKDELLMHVFLGQFLLAPALVINLLLQFGMLKNKDAWGFVIGVLQAAGLAVALYASHILPSLRLGFAPEPLASLYYGPRIAPEGDSSSSIPLFARGRSSLQLSATMRGGEGVSFDSSLRHNLLANQVPSSTRQGSGRELGDPTSRDPDGTVLVALHDLTDLATDAPLLQEAHASPALERWELQLWQWRSMVPTLQVHLDHPAILQYLKEAVPVPLSAASPKGTSIGSFSNKKKGSSCEGNSTDRPVNATAKGRRSIIFGTGTKIHHSPEEAQTTQGATPMPADDGKQDPEAASVAALLEAARSGLQEEAVRFVLVTLVLRALDPKDKALREMIRQLCQDLLATHFDPKCARYRLDVSSEAEAAPLREVQKLARRAVLFEDDVSSAMQSFDAAFTQVWPAVYELLANHCVSLAIMAAQLPSTDSKDETPAVKGRPRMGSAVVDAHRRASRRSSQRNSQGGTADGAALSSLLSPFAAAGVAAALTHRHSLGRPSSESDGPPTSRRPSAEGTHAPGTSVNNPWVVIQSAREPATAPQDGQALTQSGRQPPPDQRAEQEPPRPHPLEGDAHAARHQEPQPAEPAAKCQDSQEPPRVGDLSVEDKARQPSPAPPQAPPSGRRSSAGSYVTSAATHLSTLTQRAEPSSTSPNL